MTRYHPASFLRHLPAWKVTEKPERLCLHERTLILTSGYLTTTASVQKQSQFMQS